MYKTEESRCSGTDSIAGLYIPILQIFGVCDFATEIKKHEGCIFRMYCLKEHRDPF